MLATFISYEPQFWTIFVWSLFTLVITTVCGGCFFVLSTVGKSVSWLTGLCVILTSLSMIIARLSGIVMTIAFVCWVFAYFL